VLRCVAINVHVGVLRASCVAFFVRGGVAAHFSCVVALRRIFLRGGVAAHFSCVLCVARMGEACAVRSRCDR
jgi:hypothetical protein